MSVLIKGMEMPTSCKRCEFFTPFQNGFVMFGPLGHCDRLGKEVFYLENRLDNCPLIPVPPHGRLIDADALADVFRGFIAMYDSCPFSQLGPTDKARRDELQAALAEVINAPTIIEAEEKE